MTQIKMLLLDIGGVLLTNGWDHQARQRAADLFHIDFAEMENRHRLTFDLYELGKLTLDEYLDRAVFYEKRAFSKTQFKEFMYEQSQPFPAMIEMIKKFKHDYSLKVGVLSNEGREFNQYRFQKFELNTFIDFFVSSSFVHLRKPDNEMYRMALDIAQVPPAQIIYVDDRKMFVEVAQSFGMHGVHHQDLETTKSLMLSVF